MKRLPLIFSLLAVLALSASIAYWVMELYKPKQRPLAAMTDTSVAEPSADAAATLFGGEAMAVVVSNYQLTGVVAAGAEGVAILVADGQPPKALKVGSEIASGVLLKEVHPKYVMLSEGGVLKRIDLATDDKAAASMALAAPIDNGMQAQPTPQQMMPPQPQPQQPPQPAPTPVPQIANPMQVPDMSGTSVPVPPPQPNQPMEPPVANPPGVPPPPPPVQMPAPTRNMSGGQPPIQ